MTITQHNNFNLRIENSWLDGEVYGNFAQTTNALVIPIISLVGVLLNALCILVFAQIIRNEKRLNGGHMFKYLLVKSVYDCIQFVIHLYAPFYYCQQCPLTYQTLWSQVWYVWFYYYFESIVELCSGLLELAATVSLLVSLSDRFRVFNTNCLFYWVVVTSLLSSFGFYTFILFDFEIVKKENATSVPSSIARYDIGASSFSHSSLSVALKSIHSLARDGIIVVLLLVCNIFTLRHLKRLVGYKLAFTSRYKSHFQKSAVVIHMVHAERRTTIMVILTGVNYVIGHFPSMLFYLPFKLNSPFWICMRHVNLIFFYVSYVSPFFLYFSFNNHFKVHFSRLACSTVKQLRFVSKSSQVQEL